MNTYVWTTDSGIVSVENTDSRETEEEKQQNKTRGNRCNFWELNTLQKQNSRNFVDTTLRMHEKRRIQKKWKPLFGKNKTMSPTG